MPNDLIGGSTTRYQLNLIYLLDTSGSMNGERINQLNAAMEEAVQVAEEAAMAKEIRLLMRVAEFNSVAKWHIGDTRYGVEHIDWIPLKAGGTTNTAEAIDLARSVMHREFLGERNYRPIVILITDGESDYPDKTIEAVSKLKASLKSSIDPNKDKITRIAIGLTGANQEELINFASVGTIIQEDGTENENVPLVFNVDNLGQLKDVLEIVTKEAINKAVLGQLGGNDINPTYEQDNDIGWEV